MSQDAFKWGTLPDNLFRILLEHTVDLPDSTFLWPQVEHERRRAAQALVQRQVSCPTGWRVVLTARRFYSQILQGCGSPHCKTSTCASCQRRTSKRSFRSVTTLSARALAVHLASQDRAEKRLCSHLPTRRNSANDQHVLRRDEPSLGAVDQSKDGEHPPVELVMPVPRSPTSPARLEQLDRDEASSNSVKAQAIDAVSSESTKQKDPKSFAQNLFDTATVERFYTTILPVWELFSFPKLDGKTACENTCSAKQNPKDTDIHGKDSLTQCEDIDRRSIRIRNQYPSSYDTTNNQISGIHGTPKIYQQYEAVPELTETPQTLAHLTFQNVKALVKLVQECERISSKVQPSERPPTSGASNITRMHAKLLAFADHSMFYVYNTPGALLASFWKSGKDLSSRPYTLSIDFGCMVQAFHWLQKFDRDSRLALNSLSTSIKFLHTPSSTWSRSEIQKPSKQSTQDKILPQIQRTSQISGIDTFGFDDELSAAHISLQVFAVLVAIVPPCTLKVWHMVYTCHQSGRMVPQGVEDPAMIRSAQSVLDVFEDEIALNLLSRLCEALAKRLWNSDMESIARREQREKGEEPSEVHRSVAECILDKLFESQQFPLPYHTHDGKYGWRYDAAQPDEESAAAPRYIGIVAEWLRFLVSKQWDGKAEIDRFSAVGGALEILWCFDRLVETPVTFQIPVMQVRFDWLKFSTEWLSRPRIANPQHLLTYPFVFHVKSQIACFRALNYAKMFQAYEDSIVASRLLAQMSFPDPLTSRGEVRVLDKLGNLLKSYFVIEIRRESVLLDTIAQLWRRQERDLMKPLKVRMGMDEGEEGVDHGGVQQEFFRLAIAEVMNPDYGMFTIDEQSGMSWFRPCSLEPMYKFELVGLLFSLAIYNGLTLPVNFPLAFYRKLQGYEITNPLQLLDGWPALAKGLQSLLDWSAGDVGDVFARTYEFTAEGPGFNVTVDMEKNGRKTGWVPAYLNPDYCCQYCSTNARPHIYKTDETPAHPEANGSDKDEADDEKPQTPMPPDDPISDDDKTCKEKSKKPAPPETWGPDSYNNSEDKPEVPTSNDSSATMASSFRDGSNIPPARYRTPSPPTSVIELPSQLTSPTSSVESPAKERSSAKPSTIPELSEASEASLVTNANREQYVSDYIFWLTSKSIRPQFEAFANKFFTCISTRAPNLLNVRDFKRLVEGSQDISVEALRIISNYDGGYTPDHPTIIDLWDTVRDFSPQQIRLLLEFVTASDRIPATGMGSVQFSVQKNGEGDERLPTSLTCYGRLLLPQYTGRAVLREKLCLAIENSKGFGVP